MTTTTKTFITCDWEKKEIKFKLIKMENELIMLMLDYRFYFNNQMNIQIAQL